MKRIACGLLPDEVIDRPKGYFPVPSLKHVSGPYLEYMRGILTNDRARARGLFKRQYVDRLLNNPGKSLTAKGHSKLWQMAVLEGWLQIHNI